MLAAQPTSGDRKQAPRHETVSPRAGSGYAFRHRLMPSSVTVGARADSRKGLTGSAHFASNTCSDRCSPPIGVAYERTPSRGVQAVPQCSCLYKWMRPSSAQVVVFCFCSFVRDGECEVRKAHCLGGANRNRSAARDRDPAGPVKLIGRTTSDRVSKLCRSMRTLGRER